MTAKTMRREMVSPQAAARLQERTPMERVAFPAPISTPGLSSWNLVSVCSNASGPSFDALGTLSAKLADSSRRLTGHLQFLRSAASASRSAT